MFWWGFLAGILFTIIVPIIIYAILVLLSKL